MFFQDRYQATRLVDEASLLACAAYVDLNPIRAAMALTLVASDHTSVQRRNTALADREDQAPMTIDEQLNPTSPCPSNSVKRDTD